MGKPEYVQPGVSRPAMPVHLASATMMDHGAESQCGMVIKQIGLVSRTLITEAQGNCEVRFATYYFPYWRATDESGVSLLLHKDASGLLIVTLPPGKHTVSVSFQPASAVRNGGAVVSIVSVLFAVLGIVLYRKDDDRSTIPAATFARAA